MNYIAKFNPYDMTNEVILAVATGRKKNLHEVLEVIEDNLNSDGARQHLLILGPRGMGKSFFLKYLQTHVENAAQLKNCDFVLLPEEQNNMDSATDFVNMVMDQIDTGSTENVFTSWEETDEQWKQALHRLKTYIEEKRASNGPFLLVAVVENLNDFLYKIKSNNVAQSRFRSLLEKLENFMLIGASPFGKIDSDYNQRIFKAFKEFKLKPWEEEDYLRYFDRRRDLFEKEHNIKISVEEKQLQSNKLKAISKFTGGSPRMAIVLTELVLNEDVFSTANTLYGLIDALTPYYQDLTKGMRPQSRKLFDTLIRAGENKSQSELATILKTTQNKISKPFLYLQENNFIVGKKRSNSKSYYYSATDRIFVLFYHRREIYHNQNYTPVWLLSDFLLTFFQENELKEKAMQALRERPSQDAMDLAKISLLAKGMQADQLPKIKKPEEWLKILETQNTDIAIPKEIENILADLNNESNKEKRGNLLEFLYETFENKLNSKQQERSTEEILLICADLYDKKQEYRTIVSILKKLLSIKSQNFSLIYEAAIKGMLGMSLRELNEFEEANKTISGALKLLESDDKSRQYSLLYELGLSFKKNGEIKQALATFQKALKLGIKDNEEDAQTYTEIGEIYSNLQKYINLSQIGWSQRELKLYNKALSTFNESLTLLKQDKNAELEWTTGQISVIHFLLNDFESAWKKLDDFNQNKEQIFKQFGDAIVIKEKHNDLAAAFQLSIQILLGLKERANSMNIPLSLSHLFSDLLSMKVSHDLFIDITEEAKTIFLSPEAQIIINAALHTVEYLKTEKDPAYLEQLSPDEAIAIKAIVEESDL